MAYMAVKDKNFEDKVIDIARVTRVVAGGKRFSFRATVIIGNKRGRVGVGVAKGVDVAQAINKAKKDGEKNAIDILIVNGTIPHEAMAKYGSSIVLLKPALQGRGVIAGGPLRNIFELVGVENATGKILSRSGNKINISRAAIKALKMLKKPIFSQRAKRA